MKTKYQDNSRIVLGILIDQYFVATFEPFELYAYTRYNLCKMSRHKWLR